jgi:hypothetical protein
MPMSVAAVARGIGILGDVDDPGRPAARQDPAGQPDARSEVHRLGHRAEGRETLGIVEMPNAHRHELVGSILRESVDVPYGPPGVGANPVQAEPHRLVDRDRFVGRDRDRLQQLDGRRLLAERDLGLLALGDVAPRPDTLERIAALIAAQTQLIPDPAVRAILAAEPVLVGVAARLKQSRKPGQSTWPIIGMDPLQPEVRPLQILTRLVAEQIAHVLADERRRVLFLRLEAVEHDRG